MNLINRILAMLMAVLLVVFGLAALYTAAMAPTGALDYVQAWAVYLVDQITASNRVLSILVSAVAVVLGVQVLMRQRRPKQNPATVQLKKLNGGEGVLSVGAVAQRVQHDTEMIGGVLRCKPVVISRGKDVDIRIEVTTDPYVEAAPKTQEVCQVIRENVEGQMGVKVRRVVVNVTHEPIAHNAPNTQITGAS